MTAALDFNPEKIRIEDFPYPPGSAVEGSFFARYTVVDRDGFAFLACCTYHERAGIASGWNPAADNGRMLTSLTALPRLPALTCGRVSATDLTGPPHDPGDTGASDVDDWNPDGGR